MLLGKITGKVTTLHFTFTVAGAAKKFDFVQVLHPDHGYVLCQIVELVRDASNMLAECIILGYRDERGYLRPIRTPLKPSTEVLKPDETLVREIINIGNEKGAYIGMLEGTHTKVFLDFNKLLTGHISVLAKSGSGKSYTVGVLLEEIMERGVPVVVFDPHGEYESLRFPNTNKKERDLMNGFEISSKGYSKHITQYGDPTIIPEANPLRLSDSVSLQELMHLLPLKLSGAQQSLLYVAFQHCETCTFDEIVLALDQETNPTKWGIINAVTSLQKSGLFSRSAPTPQDIVKPGTCTIFNLKGIPPHLQDLAVYRTTTELFEERKKETIPPFLLVVEEAHNFVPERGFGEAKRSENLKNVISEGRKFGLGIAVVTQRPAMVQKTVLSQCTTQIILKMTNPNDLRAVASSVEGITSESENEISNLPVGTALLTGITDVPLFVRIRPRRSHHGGASVKLISDDAPEGSFEEHHNSFSKKEILPIIQPGITEKDLIVMNEKPIEKIEKVLIPIALFALKEGGHLMMNLATGKLILDKDTLTEKQIPEMKGLGKDDIELLRLIHSKKKIPANASVKQKASRLESRGYVKKEHNDYVLNDEFLFSRIGKHTHFVTPKHTEVAVTKKMKSSVTKESMEILLKQFTDVTNPTQCFLLNLQPVYKNGNIS